ncbi:MAG TPA: hypothetical protein VFM29_04110 [Vicinamibacteria bacterium]|nr:hypothetical protein [Vicinamibacteria bacterium]
MDPLHCSTCQMSDQDRRLHKCPICFKLSCDECGHHAYGRIFCTRRCAEEFFFGEDDE